MKKKNLKLTALEITIKLFLLSHDFWPCSFITAVLLLKCCSVSEEVSVIEKEPDR